MPVQDRDEGLRLGYEPGQYPCTRYNVAEQILSTGADIVSVDVIRSILSATNMEIQSPTVYSNVCDLGSGDIFIYYFHNYEEVVKININFFSTPSV